MGSLKENVEEILEGGYYSYATITGFGWGCHLDSSRGGLVVEMLGRGNIIAFMNDDENGFVLAYDYNLSEQEQRDIDNLFSWITE
jgi:hypothetical protein